MPNIGISGPVAAATGQFAVIDAQYLQDSVEGATKSERAYDRWPLLRRLSIRKAAPALTRANASGEMLVVHADGVKRIASDEGRAPWLKYAALGVFALLPKCPFCVLAAFGIVGSLEASSWVTRLIGGPRWTMWGAAVLALAVFGFARRRGARATAWVVGVAVLLWSVKFVWGADTTLVAAACVLVALLGLRMLARRSMAATVRDTDDLMVQCGDAVCACGRGKSRDALDAKSSPTALSSPYP
jgi:hypothetical protein